MSDASDTDIPFFRGRVRALLSPTWIRVRAARIVLVDEEALMLGSEGGVDCAWSSWEVLRRKVERCINNGYHDIGVLPADCPALRQHHVIALVERQQDLIQSALAGELPAPGVDPAELRLAFAGACTVNAAALKLPLRASVAGADQLGLAERLAELARHLMATQGPTVADEVITRLRRLNAPAFAALATRLLAEQVTTSVAVPAAPACARMRTAL